MNNSTKATYELIGRDGTFNVNGIERFAKDVDLTKRGLLYGIVSIFGPQHSGKSTLLNHIFGTNFKEMDEHNGRLDSATTVGILLGCDMKQQDQQPLILAMDVEGADSQDRKNDRAFEKQSALFALAVSDVVLMNLWYHDIGRTNAACNPLLETVFQVMRRLFKTRKITLIIVIRDMTSKIPFGNVKQHVEKNIQKIWDSVPKAPNREQIPLSRVFKVEVFALSHYEHERQKFEEEVCRLRVKINHSIAPRKLDEDRNEVVPASDLPFSMQKIWETIKNNKDLNLPEHKVMVSTVRCLEIADEIYRKFAQNLGCIDKEEASSQYGLCSKYGKKFNLIIGDWLSEYDSKVADYDADVRANKRKKLEHDLLKLCEPAVKIILRKLRLYFEEKFKEAFNVSINRGEGFSATFYRCKENCETLFAEGCTDPFIEQLGKANSDVISRSRSNLLNDLDEYMETVCLSKFNELVSLNQAKSKKALTEHVKRDLVDNANGESWPLMRKNLRRERDLAKTNLERDFSRFDLPEKGQKEMIAMLEDYARSVIEEKVKENAQNISRLMNARFTKLFCFAGKVQRQWTKKAIVKAVKEDAHYACIKLLSVLAAIQLDDNEFEDLEKYLVVLLDTKGKKSWDEKFNKRSDVEHLASSNWNKIIPLSKTIIPPDQCLLLWKQFREETDPTIQDAYEEVKLYKSERYYRRGSTAAFLMAKVMLCIALSIATGGGNFFNPLQ